ncbi:MAG: fluoride efflux transporter CrcB [Pyrinomonadaceae bacterium]
MDRNIILVGIGGFFGSVLRNVVTVLLTREVLSSFPYGTLVVNVTGCFLVGVIFALSERGNILSPEWRIFLTTGFCGGFTTFSTFSYESVRLMQDGELLFLSLNVAASVILGFAATYLGILLVRSV